MGREYENDKYLIIQRNYYPGFCMDRLRERIISNIARIISSA
jgi:hypothetical protein